MTNNLRMPVVGDIYRHKKTKNLYRLAFQLGYSDYVVVNIEDYKNNFTYSDSAESIRLFWNTFEQIPQDPISQPSIPEKEERLPEVGRRYKCINGEFPNRFKFGIVKTSDEDNVTYTLFESDESFIGINSFCDASRFWRIFKEIPSNSQKPQIIDELYISGRGLCFVVEKDREWKIGDTIKKDDKEYIITGIDNGRKSLGLIVRDNSQKPSEVQVKQSTLSDPLESLYAKLWCLSEQEPDKYGELYNLADEARKKRGLSDEVKKAMEELEKYIKEWGEYLISEHPKSVLGLIQFSENLLDALESMDKSNIPEKGDCGIVDDTKAQIECMCKLTKQIGSGSCIACQEYNKWIQETSVITVSTQYEEVEEEKKSEKKKPHGEYCDCTNISRTTYSMGNQCMMREINEALSEEREKPKSIWKDVSKIYCREETSVLARNKEHQYNFVKIPAYDPCNPWQYLAFQNDEIEYCELTDFINYIDSLEQRINKLENK